MRSLPPWMRWEVTRRHPVYIHFWAEITPGQYPGKDPNIFPVLKASRDLFLSLIGVNPQGIPPETEFDKIEPDQFPEWMAGCIQPHTFRDLAAQLLDALPDDDIKIIAEIFAAAANSEPGQFPPKFAAMQKLRSVKSDRLDCFADELWFRSIRLLPPGNCKMI
ncbi:hypothetical protein [Stratiformator vulcanicus]|nr:hypothetical protein [Stratiformator vulcanicus]